MIPAGTPNAASPPIGAGSGRSRRESAAESRCGATEHWYALFIVITMMPLTNAILLTFSAPLWMPVIAWAVLREQAPKATWVGAAIGFVGVVLVLQPHHQHFNIGALFALAGAFFLAIAMMSVRWLGATEPMPRILFSYFLFSTVLVAPFALVEWKPFGCGDRCT